MCSSLYKWFHVNVHPIHQIQEILERETGLYSTFEPYGFHISVGFHGYKERQNSAQCIKMCERERQNFISDVNHTRQREQFNLRETQCATVKKNTLPLFTYLISTGLQAEQL